MASELRQVLIQAMPDIDHPDDFPVLLPHKDKLRRRNPPFRNSRRIPVLFQETDPLLRIVEFAESVGTVHGVPAVHKLPAIGADLLTVFHRRFRQYHRASSSMYLSGLPDFRLPGAPAYPVCTEPPSQP